MADNMRDAAKEAVEAAKAGVGVRESKRVYEMCGTDQTTVGKLAVALLQWDTARMEAEVRRLEAEVALARLKGRPAISGP